MVRRPRKHGALRSSRRRRNRRVGHPTSAAAVATTPKPKHATAVTVIDPGIPLWTRDKSLLGPYIEAKAEEVRNGKFMDVTAFKQWWMETVNAIAAQHGAAQPNGAAGTEVDPSPV